LPDDSRAVTALAQFKEALEAFHRGDLDRARAVAERGVEQSPTPDLEHLVGLIHCRQGNAGAGVDWLRRASESDPANIGFKVMLARALIDLGRPAEALTVADTPAGTSPAELALLHARAEAADAVGDVQAAIDAWGGVCRAGVGNWRAWASYGGALAAAERWGQAETALRKAAELEPTDATVRRSLAVALARRGRQNEAADELLKWSEEGSADAHGRVLLAHLLADLGREGEAMVLFNRVLQDATGQPFEESGKGLVEAAISGDGQVDLPLLRAIARLMERTNRIEALRKLLGDAEAAGLKREQLAHSAAALALRDGEPEEARRLLENDRPFSDPLRAHRLMAKIADALDDPATAFAEAQQMNLAVDDHDRWLQRGRRYIETVRAVAEAVTPEWGARLKPLKPPQRGSPAFLVGFPRSGTTLLDTFLMGHPDTLVLEEAPMITEAQRQLGERADLADLSPGELEGARDAYFAALDRYVPEGFGGLVVDKLPLNMLAARFIHSLFPDAKFIFAQRHPCDSIISCLMQPFELTEPMACFLALETAADFYDAAMTLWTRCNAALPVNVHKLAYEDLVADPDATLRPLVDFLGLDWREQLLDHRATARARGVISTPSYDQVVQPINTRSSGRWRRYRKQLQPVLPVLLPWAERLGYAR
jgi:Flp pilus assembly protein TadD